MISLLTGNTGQMREAAAGSGDTKLTFPQEKGAGFPDLLESRVLRLVGGQQGGRQVWHVLRVVHPSPCHPMKHVVHTKWFQNGGGSEGMAHRSKGGKTRRGKPSEPNQMSLCPQAARSKQQHLQNSYYAADTILIMSHALTCLTHTIAL